MAEELGPARVQLVGLVPEPRSELGAEEGDHRAEAVAARHEKLSFLPAMHDAPQGSQTVGGELF